MDPKKITDSEGMITIIIDWPLLLMIRENHSSPEQALRIQVKFKSPSKIAVF